MNVKTSDDLERGLACVLDTLLPPTPDGRVPGAGALGLGESLAAKADLAEVIRVGLIGLDRLARERGASDFASVAPEQRAELLEALAATDPGFVPALVFHGYVAYYQHPQVVEALGLEARPPHPAGYPIEPWDQGLLEPVRGRTRLFREV